MKNMNLHVEQEDYPRYHAEIAQWQVEFHHPADFGSATPCLESLSRAEKDVYHLLSLPNRVNNKLS